MTHPAGTGASQPSEATSGPTMTPEQRAELVREVAEALEDEDRRRTLVNYWFETVGGGWVKPDWSAIAEVAVDLTLIARRSDPSTNAPEDSR